MTETTARLNLPFPDHDNGESPAGPAQIKALAQALDNSAVYGQGTLAARPSFGLQGRLYLVKGDSTAANNGVLWCDNGTGWTEVGLHLSGDATVTGAMNVDEGGTGAQLSFGASADAGMKRAVEGGGVVEIQLLNTARLRSSDGTDSLFTIDMQGENTITIANNGTAYPAGNLNNGSGLMILIDTTNDAIAMFLLAGGFTAMAAQTGNLFSDTAGATGKTIVTQAGGPWKIENKTGGTVVYRFFTIRMNYPG